MSGQPVETLLVEDNEDDMVIIQEELADMKLATIMNTVRNGEEALAICIVKENTKLSACPI
ncbi:MAG: hypothetical protein ABI980_11160 [Nitrospirota bacterium]